MTEGGKFIYPIDISATGTILNPWYEFPARVTIDDPENPVSQNDGPEIVPSLRVTLDEFGLTLFFHNAHVGFVFADNSDKAQNAFESVRIYLAYRTYVNYNVIGFFRRPQNEGAFREASVVPFHLERIHRVETEVKLDERVVHAFHHEGVPESIEVSVEELRRHLKVVDATLYYSIGSYLLGCQNPRYFLVEFHKAVEVIRLKLGSKDSFLDVMKPYGVTRTKYKEFGQLCNDMRAPLDIGRHAPTPDAKLQFVDIRNLLVEPHSQELFESATVFCRQVIDGYQAYRVLHAA